MDHFEDWLRRLNPPRRNHFFTGKMMGVAQFEREQRYGMGQRWLLNRLTLGTGILCGLEVTVTSDGRLRVEPGVAVDPLGREIVVARPVTGYDPFKSGGDCGCGEGPGISEAGDYLLCLTYRECTADEQPAIYSEDCSGQPDCQPDTTIETFALSARPAPAASGGFDCDAWTAIAGSAPPGIAVLRQRLARQFGASCGNIPPDACVPLGRITVAKSNDGAAWAPLSISDDARVQIYSQAQLLDIILCLASQVARCCGQENEPTLRVAEVKAVRRGVDDTFTDIVETDPPNEGWPVYEPEAEVAAILAAAPVPYVNFLLQVTFNGPVAPESLPLFSGDMTIRSISLELTRTRGDITDTVGIPLVGLLLPAPANNDKLILFTRPSNIVTHVPPRLGDIGVYELTLHGSDDAPFVAIRSSQTNEMLDGDENTDPQLPAGRRFPSGDGTHGGDFIFKFEIRAPEEAPDAAPESADDAVPD